MVALSLDLLSRHDYIIQATALPSLPSDNHPMQASKNAILNSKELLFHKAHTMLKTTIDPTTLPQPYKFSEVAAGLH